MKMRREKALRIKYFRKDRDKFSGGWIHFFDREENALPVVGATVGITLGASRWRVMEVGYAFKWSKEKGASVLQHMNVKICKYDYGTDDLEGV